MRSKSLMLLALALGCGLIASIGISQVMDRQGGAALETEPIYVASLDIMVGEAITPEMVKIEDWPKSKIPPGAVREFEQLEGQRPKSKVFSGSPILEQMLGGGGLASRTIPKGMRAISVKLGPTAVGAELLTPGDRVDVQLTVEPGPKLHISQAMTKVILINVRVWAVDQMIDRSAEDSDKRIARIVSLVVTLEQADKLDLAQRIGRIRLTLRHPDDLSESVSSGITVGELIDGSIKDTRHVANNNQRSMPDKVIRSKPVSEAAWTMQVIEGEMVRELSFDRDGKVLNRDESKQEEQDLFIESAAEPAAEKAGGGESNIGKMKKLLDFLSNAAKK